MKVGCAILGATGAVGQRFIQRLENHPFFEIRALVASSKSAGKPYSVAAHWILDTEMPASIAGMRVATMDALTGHDDVAICFSALPAKLAQKHERALCSLGYHVFTNASTHRMDADVPLLIPEVNPDHLSLLATQTAPGKLIANGNCSGIVLALALAPLHAQFGIDDVSVTTLQGLSGAGYPGVSALDVIDNIMPNIGGEEEKLEAEPQKTLGGKQPAQFDIRATCTRVPVREGHFESVDLLLSKDATHAQVAAAFTSFAGSTQLAAMPSAPRTPIVVTEDVDRPQPRRDRDAGNGMAITVGRIRVKGRRVRFVVLGHNTVRGAAGQSVLNAEFALKTGAIECAVGGAN